MNGLKVIGGVADFDRLFYIIEELNVIDTSALYKYAEDENDAVLLDLSFLKYTKVSCKLERAYRGEGIDVLNTYQLEDGTLLGNKIKQAIKLKCLKFLIYITN